MATNLAAAGHDVVVRIRTRATADMVAADIGATVAGTPAAAADGADVVITMLVDEHALRAVCTGPEGVLAGLGPGTVSCDRPPRRAAALRRMHPGLTASLGAGKGS